MTIGGDGFWFHRRLSVRSLRRRANDDRERTAPLDNDFDVVIAGGGIAGLTAGTVSARLGRKTLVVVGDMLGGNLLSIERIEGYPGFPDGVAGYELCPAAQAQAAEAGAAFAMTALDRLERRDDDWRIETRDGGYIARAVILATGSSPSWAAAIRRCRRR